MRLRRIQRENRFSKGYEYLLPEKIKYSDIKNKINSRDEYNTQIKLLNAFTVRHSENVIHTDRGANIPYYLKHQIETKLEVINKKRAKRKEKYEQLEMTDRNKKLGVKAKNFDDSNVLKINKKTFNYKYMSKKDLEYYLKSLNEFNENEEEKNRRYVENLFEAIKNNFSEEQAEKLISVIKKLSDDVIIQKYYTDVNLNIDFMYDPLENDLKYDILLDSWGELIE